MPFTDTLLTRISETSSLDAAAKSLLAAFVEANRPFLERLGPAAADTFFQAVFAGQPASWETLVSQMDQTQLVNLLGQSESALDSCITARAQAVARLQTFTNTATQAALQLLAHALLSVL